MRHGRYVGPLPNLKDKTALLQLDEANGRVLAQFDDITTGMGHGWADFGVEDWDITPPTDWTDPSDPQQALPLDMEPSTDV